MENVRKIYMDTRYDVYVEFVSANVYVFACLDGWMAGQTLFYISSFAQVRKTNVVERYIFSLTSLPIPIDFVV